MESDRQSIARLEDQIISAFGHSAIRRAAAAAETDCTVDLGAKMIRDEHLQTLEAEIKAGKFCTTTTLSFNACPMITTLPDLTGMDSLRTLTMINATALASLPDLSSLSSLQCIKLENCHRLTALPKLRTGLEWDDAHLPEHLRTT